MGFWRFLGELALFRAIFGLFEDRSQHNDDSLNPFPHGYGHDNFADDPVDRIDYLSGGPDRYDPLDDDLEDDMDYDYFDDF